jgi:uncharacterized membrane protein
MNEQVPSAASSEALQSARTLTIVVYALQAASFLVGMTFVVAVIINYVKRDDVRGTYLESHFRWQIRTFWYSLLWALVGILTLVLVVGYFVLVADAIWVVYRIVRGWLRVNDGKPMYEG